MNSSSTITIVSVPETDEGSALTEPLPITSPLSAGELAHRQAELKQRSELMAGAIARIQNDNKAAKQKSYDDTGSYWRRRDEHRRADGRAEHNKLMKSVMAEKRARDAHESGRVIIPRKNLSGLTAEEKAEYKREQGRVRQERRRGMNPPLGPKPVADETAFRFKIPIEPDLYDDSEVRSVVDEIDREQKAASER